jgi:thiamine kinase-like enzyme
MADLATGHDPAMTGRAGAAAGGAIDTELAQALGAFGAGRAALGAGVRATPLAGGLANRSWLVSSAVGRWVVRLAGASDSRFAINRVAEYQVQAVAAAFGFAPAVVHAAPAEGLLVSEHLAGRTWTRADLCSPDGIRSLGARLSELHSLPPPRTVRRIDVHEVLTHYLELPEAGARAFPREDISARLRWSLATYKAGPSVLCHNDLHHLNIIAGERLVFVDWEYAGVGDPLLELAAVIGYHDLDAGQREALLAAHGGGFRSEDVVRMCLVFDCLHALWLDAANGWESLEDERRVALLARLAVDPADRQR